MKTVLIISYSPLHKDPRILRQIQALKDEYSITTMGFTESGEDDCNGKIKHISLEPYKGNGIIGKIKSLFRILLKRYDVLMESASNTKYIIDMADSISKPNVIIANDYDGLYLASRLIEKNKWDVKLYFDAHEYFPKQRRSIKWKLITLPRIKHVFKNCMKYVSVMTTVADGIAREYEKYLKLPINSIEIITNAADYEPNLVPSQTKEKEVTIIHHGGAIKERKLELMIEMMDYLDSKVYSLTFMLVPSDKAYYDSLVAMAKGKENIHFVPPVPFREIPSFINKFDIGLYLISPTNFNNEHSLPNKLFEYIQARLAIVIGPSVEMKDIVNRYELGVVAKEFTSKALAEEVLSMTQEDIMKFKMNCNLYAHELSAETNLVKLREIVAGLAS